MTPEALPSSVVMFSLYLKQNTYYVIISTDSGHEVAITQCLPERTKNTAINLNQDGSEQAEIRAKHTPNGSQKCHCLGQPAR